MYRLGIWLIAFAFVFNGAGSYAAINLAMPLPLTAQGHHGSVADARSDQHGVAAATEHGQVHKHGRNGLNCCRTCNGASVLPDVAAISALLSYDVVTFGTRQQDLVGHSVALDPGIPKTIV